MKISAHGKTIKVNLNFNKGVFTNAQGEETDESDDGEEEINSLQTARQYMLMDDRATSRIIGVPSRKGESGDPVNDPRHKDYRNWENQEARDMYTRRRIAQVSGTNCYNFKDTPMGHWRREEKEPLPRKNVNTYSLRSRQIVFEEDLSLRPRLNLDFSGQMEHEEKEQRKMLQKNMAAMIQKHQWNIDLSEVSEGLKKEIEEQKKTSAEKKEDVAKTARTIQHDDGVQYTVQDGRPAVDGYLTHWKELAKANEREEMWPFALMHWRRTDFCTVPRCHRFMDGVVEYLDEEDYTEVYTQVCRTHGNGKKWRGVKIQRFIEWGTKDENSDQMMAEYKKAFGIQKKIIRRCNSEPTFLGETAEEEQKIPRLSELGKKYSKNE
jgi:hypothetical protein